MELFTTFYIGLISCAPQKEKNEVVNYNLTENELIEKGHYLVNIIGCHDCHTPKIMTERGPVPDTLKKDDDMKAIFAYLKSTKPVRNVVPPAVSLEELDLK